MNPVVDMVLESGLIDKAAVELLEKSGTLPEGSSDKVKETILDASRATLRQFADDLFDLITKEHDKAAQLRETVLDLRTLRWPVDLSLQAINPETGNYKTQSFFKAMVDHQGRYYVRTQDSTLQDLMPGRHLVRYHESNKILREVIETAREMYLDDKQVCYLVTTVPEPK